MSSQASPLGPSRAPSPNSRFQGQASGTEEVLKSQTVGLVHLTDFRKRQAEALEQNEGSFINTNFSSSNKSFERKAEGSTKDDIITRGSSPNPQVPAIEKSAKRKRRKLAAKSKLSFGGDDDEETQHDGSLNPDLRQRDLSVRHADPTEARTASPISSGVLEHNGSEAERRLGPNKDVSVAPKVMTKAALLREAQTREKLRKDFLVAQEAVKNTEIIVPFVFYDGTNVPGGKCKVKKGDLVWVLLDRARRIAAELGSSEGERSSSRREWARIGVDDLVLVRGDVIIPHHYEIYYFVVNKTTGPGSRLLFDYSDSAPSRKLIDGAEPHGLLIRPPEMSNDIVPKANDLQDLEGADDEPTFTKVVDRRWYERNKHIYPASTWREFDPSKDYKTNMRRDAQGNAYFYS